MWLGVWERNERAKAFYARQGFRQVGRQIFVVGSDPQTDNRPPVEVARATMTSVLPNVGCTWLDVSSITGPPVAVSLRGVAGNDYDSSDVVGSELREVRINLVTRTRLDDPRNPDDAGVGQARENRDTNVPGDDGKHRRVHTATVFLRNLTL